MNASSKVSETGETVECSGKKIYKSLYKDKQMLCLLWVAQHSCGSGHGYFWPIMAHYGHKRPLPGRRLRRAADTHCLEAQNDRNENILQMCRTTL